MMALKGLRLCFCFCFLFAFLIISSARSTVFDLSGEEMVDTTLMEIEGRSLRVHLNDYHEASANKRNEPGNKIGRPRRT